MSNLLSQASLVMIPSGYKEDVVYSQIPTDGSGDLAFTRASNGTRVNSAGLVEVCPWNLLQQSENFDVSPWTKSSGVTISANSVTAPNGTTTADVITFNGSNRDVQQVIAVTNGVFSFYAKGSGTIFVGIASGTQTQTEFTLTSDWSRIEVPFTGTSSSVFIGNYGTTATSVTLWGAQLNIGSTAKPYFPTTDRLNVPRLTYQNGGGGCPSLLLEKQSTNLVTYSEQFDNAAWSNASSSVTANNTTSPDGTQNADLITFTSTTYASIYQAATTTNGATYTASVYAKKGNQNFFGLEIRGASSSTDTVFNLNTGVVVSGTGTIESVGNGWYRCTITKAANSTSTLLIIGRGDSGANNDTVYLWGAQLEASSYPTSYIPTTSSSATRVADECRKSSISSLIGQTEGVLFADVNLTTRQSFTYISISNGGSSANYIGIYFRAAAIEMEVVNGGVLQGNVQYSNTSTGRFKIAIGYKQNDFVLYVNGTQIGTDTSGTIPTCDRLDLFAFNDNQPLQVNETILFPTRLTNAELASLTTI